MRKSRTVKGDAGITDRFSIPDWKGEEHMGLTTGRRVLILAPLDNRYKEALHDLGDGKLYGLITTVVHGSPSTEEMKKGIKDKISISGTILNYDTLPFAPVGIHLFSAPTLLSQEESTAFFARFPHLLI